MKIWPFLSIIKFCLLLLMLSACQVDDIITELEDSDEDLSEDIQYKKLLALYPNQVSYVFYDLDEKKVVIANNADDYLIPASIHKILTNYAALEVLGAEARFSTTISHNGKIKKGVLYGDIIIKAGGDPNLNISDLNNFVLALVTEGITEIRGDIIYDDSFFPYFGQINPRQPDYARYNQIVSSFVFENNHFRILQNGGSSELVAIPETKMLSEKKKKQLFKSFRVNTREHGYNLDFFAAREATLPVKNPGFYTARILQILLQNMGVESRKIKSFKQVKAKKFENLKLIYQYEGDYLGHYVSDSLLNSNNLVTEMLLLHVVKFLGCEYNNLRQAAKCLQSWYQENFPNQNWLDLNWENGSGLSAKAKISVLHVNDVLVEAFKQKYGNDYFLSFLPVSGLNGTLKNKFSDKSLRVVAKTGTMNYVTSLAGYLFANDKKYSFVIMVNNKILRDIMYDSDEDMLRKKVQDSKKTWRVDALKLQSKILDEFL